MTIDRIPLVKAGLYKRIIEDYLNNDSKVRPFYRHQPTLEVNDELITGRKQHPVDRSVLVQSLTNQYQTIHLDESSLVRKNIQRLGDERSFTVTTGHQLNLFGGPHYFFYKIIDTINLAKRLGAKHPDNHFIPVFWMASEDHDFYEINHFHHNGKRLSWTTSQSGCVGRMSPKPTLEIIEALTDDLNIEPVLGARIRHLLHNAHSTSETLAEATRKWVHELFEESGLLIIDGDDNLLKRQLIPSMKADIFENTSYQMVEETNGQLEEQGYHQQVHVREINFFYAKGEIRSRLIKKRTGYSVVDTDIEFSRAELEKEIEAHPEYFSPNALLRPIYQETILPNLTYVGGAGEIAYWFQLKSTFDRYKVFYPQLMVRNSVVWIPSRLKKRMEALEVKFIELFDGWDRLRQEWVEGSSIEHFLQTAEAIINTMDEMKNRSKTEYQELEVTVGVFASEQKHRLKKFKQVLRRVAQKHESKKLEDLKKGYDHVFPKGHFQERYDNFIWQYLNQGDEYFRSVTGALEPFGHQVVVLESPK